MPGKDTRIGERVPASLRIRLKYTDESQFVQRYGANISRGGIFIATRAPKPVGTTLRFEFQLADGEPLIRGEGAVVWVKPFDAAQPTKAHGMGVRFTYLAPESRAVIDRALAWKESRRHAEATVARPVDEEGPAEGDPEDTRRVNIAAVLARGQRSDGAPEPTPAEELFGRGGGREVARPVTIEIEADEPSDDELPPVPRAAAPEPPSRVPAAAPSIAAAPRESAPEAEPPIAAAPTVVNAAPRALVPLDDDDDESGEITIEPANDSEFSDGPTVANKAPFGLLDLRAAAALESAAKAADPAPREVAPASQAMAKATTGASPAPSVSVAVPPARARVAGLDLALAALAAAPPRADGDGEDDLDAIAADLGLSDEVLAAEMARARSRVAALVEKLSGGEGEFDWLREPPRPEPLPSPAQARGLLQRMLGKTSER